MYQRGHLFKGWNHGDCEWGCSAYDAPDYPCTGRQSLTGKFYLPHQCDEWEIGGVDELMRLFEDVKTALKAEGVQI